MTDYLIRHRTLYKYEREALDSQNLSCLVPGDFPGQCLLGWTLEIGPEPEWRTHWFDVYGNRREAFSLATAHDQLDVELFARVRRDQPLGLSSSLPWEAAVLPDGSAWKEAPPMMREFVCASPLLPVQRRAGFDAEDCFEAGVPVERALLRFMQRVYELFDYDPTATTTFTDLDEVYEKKAGVCQDFAHAAIAELRRRGFSAGYVSGYLETLPLPGKEKLRGADATHAWYAVYVPGTGWMHFDPTNNVVPGTRHVITAWGRDYSDVAPVKGVVLGGGAHKVDVQVDVWQWPDQVPEEYQSLGL
ncbi:transglutaminase family protein [Kiritimatiellota bacterium B12222]|nr:transglutaminase family protein [Kiritimatiellota bacterium B12222]